MPALPADIVRVMRASRVVTWADNALLADFPAARDGLAEPDEGFFENAADAEAALAVKAALIGRPSRRFAVFAQADLDLDPVTAIPSFALDDPSLGIDGTGLPARVEIDLDSGRLALELVV
jgi:hypothetical protein